MKCRNSNYMFTANVTALVVCFAATSSLAVANACGFDLTNVTVMTQATSKSDTKNIVSNKKRPDNGEINFSKNVEHTVDAGVTDPKTLHSPMPVLGSVDKVLESPEKLKHRLEEFEKIKPKSNASASKPSRKIKNLNFKR